MTNLEYKLKNLELKYKEIYFLFQKAILKIPDEEWQKQKLEELEKIYAETKTRINQL